MRIRASEMLIVGALALVVSAPPSFAQQCDDFDECTTNDMCSDEMCTGVFQSGAGCNDFDDCTINDRCVIDPVFGEDCQGQPASPGTRCADGCGTCQSFPGLGMVCMGDGSTQGNKCDPGLGTACVDGSCQVPGGFAFCFPTIKECPDTDGNPCTDSCDIESGTCSNTVPKCLPQCETCNTSTGQCQPVNENGACDDFDDCTSQSRCETVDIGEGVLRGLCVQGEANATPTVTAGPTPTATQPTGGACVGDCNDSGDVVVNELVIGVNIALGNQPVSACPSFDVNHGNSVEVNELVAGVNDSLNGC